MTCKQCGAYLPDDATFCPVCGCAKDPGQGAGAQQQAGGYQQQGQPYQQSYQQQGQGYYQQQGGQGHYCSTCNNFLPAGTAVCPYFGARQYVPGYPQKSKVAAGVLGILLGGFGAHNFYLGYTGKAVLQLVLTLCSCGIASLWGFIEGILILTGSIGTDANGVPLSN